MTLDLSPTFVGFDKPFAFYRPPREAQFRGFELAKDAESWGHLWSPRVGKTKVILDEWRYNVELGRLDALVVLAYPSDVHLVWQDEAPKDLPPEFLARTKVLTWRRGKMDTVGRRAELAAIVSYDGPVIFAMNCEALMTPLGYSSLEKLIEKKRTMLVIDEDWCVNWSARTNRIVNFGKRRNVKMRRWLTGTPVEESPHDVYFPTQFLKWGALGFGSALTFRNHFAEYEEKHNHNTGRDYREIIEYKNLDELREKLYRFCDYAERKGSSKVNAERYFTMTDRQRAVYDEMREGYTIQLARGEVTVPDVLTRLTRLSMIARNYYPPERVGVWCQVCKGTGRLSDGVECAKCEGIGIGVEMTALERIDTRNPAAEALEAELRHSRRPFVVWCKHIQEVEDALAAARLVYSNVGRFDGAVNQRDRRAVYEGFRAGDLMGIVATEKSGLSRGHELHPRAKLTIYYSNEWSARDRKQSSDRTESGEADTWSDEVDLIAADTRDLEVIAALREKRSLAEIVMGKGF